MSLISVCIPVFNGENYIKESIESVLDQTEQSFELIIADNCSTDRTLEIAAEYNDHRIRVCKNEKSDSFFVVLSISKTLSKSFVFPVVIVNLTWMSSSVK